MEDFYYAGVCLLCSKLAEHGNSTAMRLQ